MTTEMLKKGYLLFPKALFEEQMNMKTGEKAADAFEAFVFVLTHVNYSTVTCNVRGHLFDCVRGESVLSLARWMEILGWPRNRTRYFFNKMFDAGIVERVANPYVMHIRIPDYGTLVCPVSQVFFSPDIPDIPCNDTGDPLFPAVFCKIPCDLVQIIRY